MSDESATCAYTHDLHSGTWECPHTPDEGSLCVFHRPVDETPPGAAADAFRDLVDEPGRRCKEFVGARFAHLDLAFARLDAPDNHPISLVDAHVAGQFRLTSGEVTQPLVLDGLTVEGETICENATFEAECAAAGATFGQRADFQGAVFAERVRMEDATISGPANFHAVTFAEAADFDGTAFESPADFGSTSFEGIASFDGATVADSASFEGARFEARADFRHARFGDRAVFRDAYFGDSVVFGSPDDGDEAVEHHHGDQATHPVFEFEGALEHVHRQQYDAEDERAVDADAPHFAGEADFLDAEFVEEVRFAAIEFGAPPSFRDVIFRDRVTITAPRVEGQVVDIRDSIVPAGRLGQCPDGDVVYDLENATVGDVDIESGVASPFDHCHFLHTTFDGFDFARYRDSVAAADWQIHTTLDSLDRDPPSRGALEATYLKAKTGAQTVSDDTAAAEFFRQELDYRRRGHWHRFRTGDGPGARLLSLARGVANALLKASSGYGGRPSRVVLFSLCLVVGFAPVFWVLHPEPPYPSVPRLGYLLLSFESFVTGIRAGGPTLSDPVVRFVSETEAFIGAFMIALFVFTLTRSIDR